MKKHLTLLLSSISLIGCASSDDLSLKQNILPLQAEVCCESVQSYPWVRLEQNTDIDFELNASSPIAKRSDYKSYFSAFAFAQQSGLIEMKLRSLMLNGEVAIPHVELLDQDFNVAKTLSEQDFDIKYSDAFAKNRYEISTKVDTLQTPYMLVYVDTSQLGEKIVVPHPAKVRAEESGEPMPIVTDPIYLSSNNGDFSLQIETLTLSGYNQKSLVESVAEDKKVTTQPKITVTQQTQTYYHNAITAAVKSNDLDKALALLEEAKALKITDAQQVFIKAVNAQ